MSTQQQSLAGEMAPVKMLWFGTIDRSKTIIKLIYLVSLKDWESKELRLGFWVNKSTF